MIDYCKNCKELTEQLAENTESIRIVRFVCKKLNKTIDYDVIVKAAVRPSANLPSIYRQKCRKYM